MKNTRASFSWMLMAPVVLGLVMVLTVLTPGQDTEKHKGPIVKDWTNHHLVFSNPGSEEEARRNGTYDRWLKITSDPRYIMQQRERSGAGDQGSGAGGQGPGIEVPAATSNSELSNSELFDSELNSPELGMTLEQRNALSVTRRLPSGLMRAILPPPGGSAGETSDAGSPLKTHNRLHRDWSETLQATSGTAGAAGATAGLGEFPATYSAGGTSCSDFAAYNNGEADSSMQADVVAYNNLYSSCNSGVPTVYWAYNTGSLGGASATIANSVVLSEDGTQVAFVQSVPYATAASGTATANTGVVPTAGTTITIGSVTYTWETTTTITTVNQMSTHGITLETEISQTLYAALTGSRANCPSSNTTCISASQTANSSVTPTLSGESVNLAASCGAGTCGNGIALSGTGANGVTLSPTSGGLSGGSGTAGVGGAQLVVLKWASGGTVSAPTTLASNGSYPNCTAPCMIAVPFSGTPTDTYSSPFINFGGNTIYVGDDAGKLHQFQNIFSSGTPSEVTTGGWPVTVNSNAALGSPVYDPTSTNVFVGDYALGSESSCYLFAATDPCGYLYSVNPSGTVVKSAQLDYNVGVLDSPIVDSTAGEVYAFAGDDGSANCSGGPCAGVFQFSTTFGSGAGGTEAAVGPGYEFMMSGAFDNAYFTTGTGNLYVVGNTGPANNTLYQIPISSNVMGSVNTGPAVATNYTNDYYSAGLQVTEFYNTSAGNHDYIFLSVLGFGQNNGNIACQSQSVIMGCVMGFDVTSGTVSSGTAATGVLAEEGGTSGIVIDNGTAGASNIYFSTLLNQSCTTSGGTGGCAVQTLQSGP